MSFLQRVCENFQYGELMNRAAKDNNPYIRLAYTSAFCIGSYAMDKYRTTKFFNPLLSETFEYIDNDLNFRYFAEQVSHHPPISACHVEGDGYTYSMNTNATTKFALSKGALMIEPKGKTYIHLSRFNETITHTRPFSIVKNLILGKMYVDCYGKLLAENSSGDTLELEVSEENSKDAGKIVGVAKDIYGNVRLRMEGFRTKYIDIIYVDENGKEVKETIFKPLEGHGFDQFYFSEFACNLNHLTDEMRKKLPPSDSRFRMDQRLLEEQDIEKAGEEKHRLEEKQRKTRKEREITKFKYKPLYFDETYDDLTGDLIYKYKGNYFEDRYKGNFEKFYDIY
jgi:hypothetical protein